MDLRMVGGPLVEDLAAPRRILSQLEREERGRVVGRKLGSTDADGRMRCRQTSSVGGTATTAAWSSHDADVRETL